MKVVVSAEMAVLTAVLDDDPAAAAELLADFDSCELRELDRAAEMLRSLIAGTEASTPRR